MVKIIKKGKLSPPPPPQWYLAELTCPRCGAVFQLDENDVLPSPPINQSFVHGGFTVITEKCLNGRREIRGPCPFCKERIVIEKMRTGL